MSVEKQLRYLANLSVYRPRDIEILNKLLGPQIGPNWRKVPQSNLAPFLGKLKTRILPIIVSGHM